MSITNEQVNSEMLFFPSNPYNGSEYINVQENTITLDEEVIKSASNGQSAMDSINASGAIWNKESVCKVVNFDNGSELNIAGNFSAWYMDTDYGTSGQKSSSYLVNSHNEMIGSFVPSIYNASTKSGFFMVADSAGYPQWSPMSAASIDIFSTDGSIKIERSPSGTDLSLDITYQAISASPLSHIQTMDMAATQGTVVSVNGGGSNTTYVAVGTILYLTNFITLTDQSKLWSIISQGDLNDAYFGIYELDMSYSSLKQCNLICRTDKFTRIGAGILEGVIMEEISILEPGKIYYIVLFYKNNSPYILGHTHNNTNVAPYIAGFTSNLTINDYPDIPDVLTWEGESLASFCILGNK